MPKLLTSVPNETAEAMSVQNSAREPSDWDEPNALSVVLQGGLFPANIIDTANNCTHWRAIFPNAQIIFSVSVTDIVVGGRPGEAFSEMRLARAFRENGQFAVALKTIADCCDVVVLSKGALPLPPIKADSPASNNFNLQLAAAQLGLSQANNAYVLRVRSDLIFTDRSFIDQYEAGVALSRGDCRVFDERVMISWLYTLNPFTVERLPLHFSDWFHFGRLEDVRSIWDVPPVSVADAVYYKTCNHFPDSNIAERLMNVRRAVEQHLVFFSMKDRVAGLTLDFHNDRRSVELSCDILVDNFVLCDLKAANCVFDKYEFEFSDPSRSINCVTPIDWARMARVKGEDRYDILRRKNSIIAKPETAPFPRYYPAQFLQTKTGVRSRSEIVSTLDNGVLLHGPYSVMPTGSYVATVNTQACRGAGSITVRATLEHGREILAERIVNLDGDLAEPLTISFSVLSRRGIDFEVVCLVEGIEIMVISGLTVSRCAYESGFQPVRALSTTRGPMRTEFGQVTVDGLKTSSNAGHLVFGPWITLDAGVYRAVCYFGEIISVRSALFEVVSGGGMTVLASQQLTATNTSGGRIVCEFELIEEMVNIEFRVFVDKKTVLTVSQVVLERDWAAKGQVDADVDAVFLG